MILLAKKVKGLKDSFGLIDIEVQRNAYGRQSESFEKNILVQFDAFDGKKKLLEFPAVFIRAPIIEKIGKNVKALAWIEPEKSIDSNSSRNIVLARQGSAIVCSFHPELTDDLSIHHYFVDMVKKSKTMVQFKNKKTR